MNKPLALTFTIFLGVSILSIFACSESNFPPADVKIRIEDGRFFPNVADIQRGTSVRWVNILPQSAENVRTVTSGAPGDTAGVGLLFDVTLEGRPGGEVEGEDFIYTFNDPGDFPYFSRFPAGSEPTGIVVVR